jgi:hypothetical protein
MSELNYSSLLSHLYLDPQILSMNVIILSLMILILTMNCLISISNLFYLLKIPFYLSSYLTNLSAYYPLKILFSLFSFYYYQTLSHFSIFINDNCNSFIFIDLLFTQIVMNSQDSLIQIFFMKLFSFLIDLNFPILSYVLSMMSIFISFLIIILI